MAVVSITINLDTTAAPNAATHLINAAQDWMDAQTPKIDYSAMTQPQKIKTYVLGILKSVVVSRQTTASTTTAQGTINTAVTAVQTEVTGGLS